LIRIVASLKKGLMIWGNCRYKASDFLHTVRYHLVGIFYNIAAR